jgi:hypothetical protein
MSEDTKMLAIMEVSAYWGNYKAYKELLIELISNHKCEIVGYDESMCIFGTSLTFTVIGTKSNIEKVKLGFVINK